MIRLSLLVLVFVWYTEAYPLVSSVNTIRYVNNAKAGWRAGANEKFENVTLNMAYQFLGLNQPLETVKNGTVYAPTPIELPDVFDARTQWPECSPAIRDQVRRFDLTLTNRNLVVIVGRLRALQYVNHYIPNDRFLGGGNVFSQMER
jgi:hypothetical protein